MTYNLAFDLLALLIILLFGVKLLEYRRSRRIFTDLMEHTRTGYYKYRYKDGVVIEANRSFFDIIELNADKDKVKGRSISELIIYIDDEDKIRERIKREGSLTNYEYRFKTLKGKDKWVLYNACLIKDHRTGEEVIEALVKDITGIKTSYDKMREAEERYRKLFINSVDLVLIYGFDGGMIEEVNPATVIFTGFSEKELTVKPFEELFHPSSRNKLREAGKDLMFSGTARLDGVIVCKNGSYKEVGLTLSMFEFKGNEIVMAIIRDVSGLVREREEQARRKEELENFWKTSVEREERLKDLRTELQITKQQIKLLKRKNVPGKTEEKE